MTMARRASLADTLKSARDVTKPDQQPEQPAAVEASTPASYTAPSRRGKRTIAGHFHPEVWKQLHAIALEEDSSLQALLREGINYVFAARGKPEIAE